MLAGRGESRNRISRVEWNLASFPTSVTRKKSPNVYKSCPKMISLQKMPKNGGDLGKLIVAKGFEKVPKVQ